MRKIEVLAFLLPAALAAACAPAPKREAHWVTATGETADQATMRAAMKACEPKIAVSTRKTLFKGTVEWGIAMLDCLHESGYVLIYDDPKELSAEDAPAP